MAKFTSFYFEVVVNEKDSRSMGVSENGTDNILRPSQTEKSHQGQLQKKKIRYRILRVENKLADHALPLPYLSFTKRYALQNIEVLWDVTPYR